MGSLGLLLSPPPCQGRLSATWESTSVPEVCEVATVWPLEGGPLASRLPRRHLTGHGEVWGDQGSPQLFLASVCS